MNRDGRRLCLVEDDPIMGESLSLRFQLEGIPHDWFRTAQEAESGLRSHDYCLLLSDINLPDRSGAQLFRALLDQGVTPPPTVFITGYGTIEQAVELLHQGASDYITKPFDLDELLEKLEVISPLLFAPESEQEHQPILGISQEMKAIETLCQRIASHPTSVLITGESGVGKEYIAKLLHDQGVADNDRPFIALNCAAFSDSLLEAELFGYEKGAFTGAQKAHRGVFEQADGGTLFFDEVGEMAPGVQSKLLRAIQEKCIRRLGSEQVVRFDARLICATNRDLKAMIGQGTFREDLFYRINGLHIKVPPLRERREDIHWFARKFIDEWANSNGRQMKLLALGEQWLLAQEWKGNLRELKHAVERACILSTTDLLGAEEFQHAEGMSGSSSDHNEVPAGDLKEFLAVQEQYAIRESLEQHGWKINETASALGISRKNLWEKMRKYCIDSPEN